MREQILAVLPQHFERRQIFPPPYAAATSTSSIETLAVTATRSGKITMSSAPCETGCAFAPPTLNAVSTIAHRAIIRSRSAMDMKVLIAGVHLRYRLQ